MSHFKRTSRILLAGLAVAALGTVGCERKEAGTRIEEKKIDVDVVDKSMEDKLQDDALIIGRVEIQKGAEADDVSIYLIDDAGKKYAVSNEDEGEKLANLNGAKVRVHGELGTIDESSIPNTQAGVDKVLNVQSYDILEFASTGTTAPQAPIMKEEVKPLDAPKVEPQTGIEQKAPGPM